MNVPKPRNHAFDFLCGICIIRMISLHVMQFCGHAQDDWWEELMQWSYYFMSFFFFKAGYFNKSVLGPSRQYCREKARRLLIPYLTTGLIGDAVYFSFLPFLIDRFHKPIEPLSWSHIWENGSFYGNSPTWFLFSFFSAYIAVHFLEKLRLRYLGGVAKVARLLYIAFPFLSYWMWTLGNPLWLSLNNVFMGIFFFELGQVWRRFLDHHERGITLAVSVALVLFFVVSNAVFHDCSYSMAANRFSGTPFITVLNISAILCGLSGLLIKVQMPRVPWINFIGEHSMVFFVSHYPMLYYYKYMHLCFGRSIFGRYDEVLVLIPIVFSICAWLVPYVERVPWLSGRWPETVPTKEMADGKQVGQGRDS